MANRMKAAVFCGTLLLFLGLRLPDLSQSLLINYASTTLISSCGSKEVSSNSALLEAATKSSSGQIIWLQAVRARCIGDEAGAYSELQDALSYSDKRLTAIRGMEPYDTSMARYAVDRYPHRAEAHFWLGDALLKENDKEGALKEYELGVELHTTDADVWDQLGQLYEERAELDLAVKAYDQACIYIDHGQHGCSHAGDIYMQLGQYELALDRFLTSIRQIGYTWLPAERRAATALIALGRSEEAIPHLTVLADHAQAISLLTELSEKGSSEAQELLGQFQEYEAERIATLYDELSTSDARLVEMRSIAPHNVSLAELAVSKYPERGEAYLWLGDALVKQGDKEGAMGIYEQGLHLYPGDGNAWATLARLYQEIGDSYATLKAWDQSCMYGDKSKHGCVNAGRIYLEQGEYGMAAARFQSSINQFSYVYIPSEKGLATALLALGRTEEAIPHLTILAQHGDMEAQEMLQQLQEDRK